MAPLRPLILCLLVIPAASQGKTWNVASLPHPLAERIHIRAEDVPPFPFKAVWLDDLHQWPDSLRIGDWVGYPSVTTWRASDSVAYGGKELLSDSLNCYRIERSFARDRRAYGPEVMWYHSRRVMRRIWFEPHRKGYYFSYIYGAKGCLARYTRRDSTLYLDEYYERGGKLLGVLLSVKADSGQVDWAFWKGKQIKAEDLISEGREFVAKEDPGW